MNKLDETKAKKMATFENLRAAHQEALVALDAADKVYQKAEAAWRKAFEAWEAAKAAWREGVN